MGRFRIEAGRMVPDYDPEELDGLLTKDGTVKDLARVWRVATEEFTPELTQREVGQLKHLMGKLGGYRRAATVLAWCAQNWEEFALGCGSRDFCGRPTIGWVLRYADAAVTMAVESTTPTASRRLEREAVEAEEGGMDEQERREYDRLLDDL